MEKPARGNGTDDVIVSSSDTACLCSGGGEAAVSFGLVHADNDILPTWKNADWWNITDDVDSYTSDLLCEHTMGVDATVGCACDMLTTDPPRQLERRRHTFVGYTAWRNGKVDDCLTSCGTRGKCGGGCVATGVGMVILTTSMSLL
jgi:hypothetical protein